MLLPLFKDLTPTIDKDEEGAQWLLMPAAGKKLKLPGAHVRGGCNDWAVKEAPQLAGEEDSWVVDSASRVEGVKPKFVNALAQSKRAIPSGAQPARLKVSQILSYACHKLLPSSSYRSIAQGTC